MTDKIKYFILIFIMIFFTSNASGNYDKLAYDFNFNDLDGSKLQLSNFKNNVIKQKINKAKKLINGEILKE